jgi:hypothetical protein
MFDTMGLQNKRERMAVKTKEIMEAAHGGIFSPPVSKRVFFTCIWRKIVGLKYIGI